jgi:protein-disulfide isomerase
VEKGRDAAFAVLDRLTTAQGQKHNLDQTKLQSCIKAQNEDGIKGSMQEAESVGVSATPTLFINGQELEGALSVAEMRAALDQALEQAGVPAPKHTADASPGKSQSASQ